LRVGAPGSAILADDEGETLMTAAPVLTTEVPSTLSHSDLDGPGYRRQRSGRGFRYFAPGAEPVTDPETVARLKDLVIPPAWQDVWISPDPLGHIQATGTDAAGRRQYLYHEQWRVERDLLKFDRVLEFGAALPKIRATVRDQIAGRGLSRERVLAAAIRLIDLGFFRAGGEEYAAENGTFGLATIRREHVRCGRDGLTFEYPAKGSIQREQAVADGPVCAVVRGLKRRRWGGPELFAYRATGPGAAPGGHDVTSGDINAYLREISGGEFTAKDFRTWNATVLAAVGLAVSENAGALETAETGKPAGEAENAGSAKSAGTAADTKAAEDARRTEAARQRAIVRVVQEVAGYLGNTPAVARASYIDPRVIERYEEGVTIRRVLGELGASSEFGELATEGRPEGAVLRLLRDARRAAAEGGVPASH
jgi:DNA topoisomerase IB